MFNIGDFARLGRVSVRMLRHYDAIGLLAPAHVDADTGYRSYAAGQLQRLNRVVALKDLGFKLNEVQAILDDEIGVDELKGMLRLRRAELEAQISADNDRLARVEARLRSIESEGQMSTQEITVKSLPAIRVAELQGSAAGWGPEEIGPVIRGLFEQLGERLRTAGLTPMGSPIARYDQGADNGDAVRVFAAVPVAAEPGDRDGVAVVELPAVERAAALLHHGSMESVMPSYEALARWVEENGLRSAGAREVTLQCPAEPDEWVTELQLPVVER
jgi:DNA-binding transcriptional MerR regulator